METVATSPTPGRQGLRLEHFIGWLQPVSVIAALLVSAAAFFLGMAAANTLLLIYMLVLLLRGKSFWPNAISFYLFLCVGLFAAHRFDADKAPDWLLFMIGPTLIAAMLLGWSGRITKYSSLIRKITGRWLRIARLHPIPASMIWACAVALAAGGAYEGWLGLLIMTAAMYVIQSSSIPWKACCWLMIGLYAAMLHLFIWKGLIYIGTEPIYYMMTYMDRIAYPVLLLLYVHLGGRSGEQSGEAREEAELKP